ncbi:unnamed protein product [Haemonchus placei]|uniref:Uncharacterized protein n=1 Tax=Haemonchus placei TaxID=6290 RepID=A0A3P8BMJ0_HAEPC|nr:unnamed protein product [Haemonchus placei]
MNTEQIMHTYGQLKYHAVASNKLIANPFALRFDGKVFQKITERIQLVGFIIPHSPPFIAGELLSHSSEVGSAPTGWRMFYVCALALPKTLNEETRTPGHSEPVESSETAIGVTINGSNLLECNSSGCTTAPASVEFSARNRLLVRVDGDIVLLHPTASRSELFLKEAQLTGSLPCLYPIEPSNSTCDELVPPVCEGATSLRVAEQLHGEWVLHAADPTYVLNWKCQVKPYEVDQHEFICQSEGWFGECERETRAILTVDAWGGFRLTSESPLHVPSELMSSGNISVTPDRLILIRDGDLVGRRYSVWVRPDYEPGSELADELSRFCIWPLPAQTCTRVSNC